MASAEQKQEQEQPPASATYEAGCHCGYIKFAFTISPGLDEYKVMQCNCSGCTRFGYLLVYPEAKDVVWHNNGRERCSNYRFNTKQKDQMFCPKCGASLGIDNRQTLTPHRYGISVRTIYGIDIDKLIYKRGDGRKKMLPAGDTSGHYWDEEKQEMK
ncbi:glutathione-dependent formaldehyde-activating enzyme [Hypoxylon argillaceum]|nr:glutathione-dependent formaldehyde-activating enzyme [Hypoxylon argillaceum]KAI1155338.1 glutathione-dependent formaldehyde-activating enzyme [Nemania diffusa]